MPKKLTRRQALLGVTSTFLLPVARAQGSDSTEATPLSVFVHGVASGDPDPSSVVIWTRISASSEPVSVRWFISKTAGFSDVVSHGEVITNHARDYTVKVVIENLAPGESYFYKFEAAGASSPIGQTRTLPIGHLETLTLAVATCSNYPFGYFNGYEFIASDPSIDFVVHLGDYIYEYDENGYGGETGKRIGRVHDPRHEAVTLDDYRKRHAQYKTDSGSLAMHASRPLIVLWDDHESANNPWMGGAKNHQADEGAWKDRRAASMQAFYEWLPVREPAAGYSREQYWRHFKFGDLASLISLETRHTARSQQIEYGRHLAEFENTEQAHAFIEANVNSPNRNMLSTEMVSFLESEIKESVQSRRRWRIIASPSIMARSISPPLDDPFFASLRHTLDEGAAAMLDSLTRLGDLQLPGDLDSWDGYPAARERFYQIAKDAGAHDLLVLAGDSHSYWANALYDSAGTSMGLELGSTGISSPRSLLDLGRDGLERFDKLNAASNKEIVWTDGQHRGFIRLRVDHSGARADFVTVSDVETRTYETKIIKSLGIQSKNGLLSYV